MKDDKNIVTQYFLENPSQMDGVKRATYAYKMMKRKPNPLGRGSSHLIREGLGMISSSQNRKKKEKGELA